MAAPKPMLATLGQPPGTADWAVEAKWDGARLLAVCEAAQCRLYSRAGNSSTAAYPEIAAELVELAAGRGLVVDGEVVAVDGGTGMPSFGLLQRRMHVARPTPQLQRMVPVRYFAFDLLALDGAEVMDRPYRERRELLHGLGLAGDVVSVPPEWPGTEAGRLLVAAKQLGGEGIVSKRWDSAYLPGRRSAAWIKTPLRREHEVLVCGYVPGSGPFGSLICGAYDGRALVYLGNVGSGFSDAEKRQLAATFGELELTIPPFDSPAPRIRGARWLLPALVGTVAYREFQGALRQPSWKGLRPEVQPGHVTVDGL